MCEGSTCVNACDNCENCQGNRCVGYCGGYCEYCSSDGRTCIEDSNNCPGCQECINGSCGGTSGCGTGEICDDGQCVYTGGGGQNPCIRDPELCGGGDDPLVVRRAPLLVDLYRNGYEMTDTQHGVEFDFFGDGEKVPTSWTALGSNNAWLVLDDGSGVVDGTKLFGNGFQYPKWSELGGFAALASFDEPANGGNGDGVIDARDAVFAHLRLWIDLNHDGIAQPAELFTLPSKSVRAIGLENELRQFTDPNGNEFGFRGKLTSANGDDATGYVYEINLTRDASRMRARGLEAGNGASTTMSVGRPAAVEN